MTVTDAYRLAHVTNPAHSGKPRHVGVRATLGG